MALMRNLPATPELTCPCENWLALWRRETGAPDTVGCAVSDCPKLAEVGAHVSRVLPVALDGLAGARYIAPMCAEHQALAGAVLEIKNAVLLARADSSAPCGR
jgi:hypothetical protein